MSSLHASPRQRTAITEWRVESRFQVDRTKLGWVSLLRLKPHTGRTHQIRVHLADMKHPLVGDRVYGRTFPKGETRNKELMVLQGFSRQALHAEKLAVDHPSSAERMEFTAPLPADMRELISKLQRVQT